MEDYLQNTNTKFNKYQSTLEEIDFYNLPDEVREQFLDFIVSITFIRNLISPDRPYVQDLPRDKDGRAIIDFTNPPLYEDISAFVPTATLYKEQGILNPYKPNKNPQSDYCRWLARDIRRSWDGYTDEKTGMYIPGDYYWYLNYCMIEQAFKDKKGIIRKTTSVPLFWEGQWWRSLAWSKARLENKNIAEIASRRKGKSLQAAGHGTRDFLIGESEEARTHIRDIYIADNSEYLTSDGILNKFESMLDFISQNTQLPRRRIRSNLKDMEWVSGYIDLNTKTKMGSLNQVLGLTISDDPDKPRGKAAAHIFFEEFGNFGRLQQTYDTTEYSVKEGDNITGVVHLFGTGGTKNANFQGALDMIYKPAGSRLLEFDNVWDISQGGKSIFFFPAYVNYGGCYNENGISDVTKALKLILMRRYDKKYSSANPASLAQAVAEEPITIQDSIMKTGGNIFPTTAINERLLEIEREANIFSDVYVGVMTTNSQGEPMFTPTGDEPIRNFPHRADEKVPGAIEIYAMPVKNSEGVVPYGRYISSQDPTDDDSRTTETLSLQSFFVFDLWTDTIVAEYTGRTDFVNDFYEQTRLMNMFYNAKMIYENNKKGVFSYYQRMHCINLLAETPEYLKDKGLQQRYSIGNKKYGIHNVGGINATGLEMFRDWLCSPVTQVVTDEETKEEKEVQVMRLYTLKTKALLQECAKYNPLGNYDRISSMIMLMLYREEKLIVKGSSSWENVSQQKTIDSDMFDEFDKLYTNQKKSWLG